MGTLSYRPDIDGLRAIAVVVVILYHFQVTGFAGGYVGVDVFFVLSGFLITRMIRAQEQAGSFSFATFYVRRARRLFPALFATTVATFLAGVLLFPPQQLERLGGSIVHALFAIANFYFWGESGYFDADAAVKPLLHTWSLGVEEQFYLVWPVLLVALLRRSARSVLPFVVCAGLLSLWLGERWLASDESAAFFLLPPRVMELALGAAMVWVAERQPRNRLVLEPFVWAGLALIAYSVFAFDEATPFPGLRALVPCVGTALVIYGGQARFSGRLLSNRPAVGVGLISYSLYLIHWPLYVFYRYYRYDELGPLEIVGLVAASFAGATLMYHLVENPIRRGIRKDRHLSGRAFGLACLGLTVLAALPALAAWKAGGWPWRLPAQVRATVDRLESKRLATLRPLDSGVGGEPFDPRMTNVLVVGDSHSRDVFNALYLNTERLPGHQFRHLWLDDPCFHLFGERPPPEGLRRSKLEECTQSVARFRESPLVDAADFVLVSTRWKATSIPDIEAFQRHLEARGPALVLLGRTAEFPHVPDLVVRFGRLQGVDRFVASKRKARLDSLNAKIERQAIELGVRYGDKLAFLCSPDRTSCDVVDDGGKLLYFDYGHWTLQGARLFGARMVESGFVADLLPGPVGR